MVNPEDVCDPLQIGVLRQQGGTASPGHGSDQAVNEAAWCDADGSAAAIDARGRLVVRRRVERLEIEPQQQPAQVALARVGACPGENLHDHRLGHSEPALAVDVRNQIRQSLVDRTTGRPVVLDPGGRVREDHRLVRGSTSDGVSPMACAPRMASASSRVIGLAGQVAKGEVDGVRLRSQAIAVHHRLDVAVLDLDVRSHSGHPRKLHLRCKGRVCRRSPVLGQDAWSRRCSSSAVSSRSTAQAESAIVSGRDDPGMGITTGAVASIQARVTC